jgi:O-antigen/teichoic acid export membrane protein
MLSFGLPFIPAQLANFVTHLSGRFFVKGYWSIADAGLYSLGARFGTLPGNFISVPFNQTWQPRRFELSKAPDSEELLGRVFTYFFYFMVFASLCVSLLTRDVLRIIADQAFWSAHAIVPLIALSVTILSMQYHFDLGIYLKNKTKYMAYINISNALIVLLLNFLLVPRYGVLGAVVTTLCAVIYRVSLTYFISSRYYKIHFEFGRIGKILLAAGAIYFCGQAIRLESVYLNLQIYAGMALMYPILLFFLGFYSKEEKQRLHELATGKISSFKRRLVS